MINKKLGVIIIAVLLVIAGIIAAIIAVVLTREGLAFNSGVFTNNRISNVSNDSWRVAPIRANGSSRIDYTFNAANLAAMRVNSTNSEGKITLKFIQGDNEKAVDITGDFNDSIDMSGFASGKIRVRLEYDNARDVDCIISWGD